MTRPLLQVALDQEDISEALAVANTLINDVDIIEAGTILCFANGTKAIKVLKSICQNKPLVADFKIADAGETLARMAMTAGANYLTVICAAPLATIAKVNETVQAYAGEVQIELFGKWTITDAKNWLELGIKQAIYHRGRDAQAKGQQWNQSDFDTMKKLSDMGIELSITGGITAEQLELFKSIRVKTFIVGRALYNHPDPIATARAFHKTLKSIWT